MLQSLLRIADHELKTLPLLSNWRERGAPCVGIEKYPHHKEKTITERFQKNLPERRA